MTTINMHISRALFSAIMLVSITSCVKDGMPPDCKKPGKPTVQNSSISVKEGYPFQLSATGPSGAQYIWSGPNGFYSESANPSIAFATISNGGTYWVKDLAGYCYSDSVPANVTVISDTTCNLGDNYGDFPNGSSGPFLLVTSCSTGSGSTYQINAKNVDSSLTISIIFNQKPTQGSKYNLTNNHNPTMGTVFYQITDQGGTHTNTTGAAYVKVGNNKINVVICGVPFLGLGVFSANVACE